MMTVTKMVAKRLGFSFAAAACLFDFTLEDCDVPLPFGS